MASSSPGGRKALEGQIIEWAWKDPSFRQQPPAHPRRVPEAGLGAKLPAGIQGARHLKPRAETPEPDSRGDDMAICSVADYLNPLAPHLPPALISAESLADMRAPARLLPGALTDYFGFECRLGVAAARADILVRTTAAQSGGEILAGRSPAFPLAEPARSHPAWRGIRRFGQRWADPALPLSTGADDVWLEFDVAEAAGPPHGDDLPVPSLFFRPRVPLPPETAVDRAAAYRRLLEAALEALLDEPMPPEVMRRLSLCLERLPPRAVLFQAGVMLSRRVEAVRLCISNVPPPQVTAYLAATGWEGPRDEVDALLATLSGFVDYLTLDLDVGATVQPKIGLECYFTGFRQPETEPRWRIFLEELVARGLCLPTKRDALLAYSGESSEQTDPERWPADLLRVSRFLGQRTTSALFRALHHVKISYQPGRTDASPALEAKAYLAVFQRWTGCDA
jgi:hypothetical protein